MKPTGLSLLTATRWLLSCVIATSVAAAPPAAEKRPNVLVLLSDDQAANTIGALGNRHIQTPNLDKLATEGIVFRQAMSNNPLCVPIRAEILTGCSGFRNGVLPGYSNKLDPSLITWGQAFQQAGYRTGWVGKWHISGRPSSQGYGEVDGLFGSGGGKPAVVQHDSHGRAVTGYTGWVFQTDGAEAADGKRRLLPEEGVGVTPDISSKFADAAIRLIRKPSDKPWLIQVNFTAPHDPLFWPPGFENRYDPAKMPLPANFRPEHPFDTGNIRGRDELLLPFPRTPQDIRRELAIYYAVISDMDAQIGRIVSALDESNQRQNTIIVFASDHGMAKGSHGLIGKQNMYEHTVTVPLMIAGPGVKAGRTTDAIINLRDLYPTTCDLAGVKTPATVEGRSGAAIVRGDADQLHDAAYGYFMNVQRMIRADGWKLIWYPQIDRTQLFNLASDPHELRDLAGEADQRQRVADLRARLSAWQKQVNDPLLKAMKH